MKAYYTDITITSIITSIIYWIGFWPIYWVVLKRLFPYLQVFFIRFYFFASLIYAGLIIFDFNNNFIPSFPDAQLYYSLLKGESSHLRVNLPYSLIVKPIFLSFNRSILTLFLFNFILFQFSFALLIKSFEKLSNSEISLNGIKKYFFLCSLMPSVIIFSITPLRESFLIFSFSLFIYGFSVKSKRIIVLGTLLTFLFRYQFILLYITIVLSKYFFRKNRILFRQLALLVLIGFPIAHQILLKLLGISLSPQGLASFRNYQTQIFKNIPTYPILDWVSWLDVLIDIPGLFFQFMFSPIPIIIKSNPTSSIIYGVDGLIVLSVFILIILKLKKITSRHFIWIIVGVLFYLFASLFEFHLYGAVRHRLPGSLILILFLISIQGFKTSASEK